MSEPHYRSKTLAAWLALLLGALGVHRLYLHGLRDRLAWCHPLPTAIGLLGVWRMRALGQDDQLAWLLIPLLGVMISAGMLTAIVYALTPDEKWDARHNPAHAVTPTGWGAVLAAVAGLLVGGTVLMGTIAFSGQKFFEWQLAPPLAQKISVLTP
jgi:TM2 domain